MGGSQSVEIPGGGTEGYHVLKVRYLYRLASCLCIPSQKQKKVTKTHFYCICITVKIVLFKLRLKIYSNFRICDVCRLFCKQVFVSRRSFTTNFINAVYFHKIFLSSYEYLQFIYSQFINIHYIVFCISEVNDIFQHGGEYFGNELCLKKSTLVMSQSQ